jgi:hypothetical protein
MECDCQPPPKAFDSHTEVAQPPWTAAALLPLWYRAGPLPTKDIVWRGN